MHYQLAPKAEAKLVRCVGGRIFDVVLDLRPASATYGQWFGLELGGDPENRHTLYVPEGCGHGCLSLEDDSEIHYMTSAFFTPSAARGARYNDPAFSIQWPLVPSVISEQDRNWPLIERSR